MLPIRSFVVAAALAASTLTAPVLPTAHADSQARLLEVSDPTAALTLAEHGARLKVTARIKNTTAQKQGASQVHVYLRKPSGASYDVLTTQVGALQAKKSTKVKLGGLVPTKVPAGTYRANVCVERKLFRNCELAPGDVVIGKAVIDLDITQVAFGLVARGAEQTADLTLTNTGVATAGAPTFGFVGDGGFSADTTDCDGRQLARNESCTITISFGSTTLDTFQSTFAAKSAPGGLDSVALSGQVVVPLELTPASHDFGDVAVGTTAPFDYLVKNLTDYEVNPSSISFSTPKGGYNFVGTADSCLDDFTILAGETCAVRIEFAPSDTDTYPGVLSVGLPHNQGVLESTSTGDGVSP